MVTVFTSVTARQDIELTIGCAAEPHLVVMGSRKGIEQLDVNNQNGALVLNNPRSRSTLNIQLFTNTPLSAIRGKMGTQINVSSCAVNPEAFQITASKGTGLNVEGRTDRLRLNLSQGASFNQMWTPFSANVAQVRLRMGAKASLCDVRTVSGTLTAGAHLSVDSSTSLDIGEEDIFASTVARSDCR